MPMIGCRFDPMETHNVRMIKSEVFPRVQIVCIYGFERCVVYAYGALFHNETLWGNNN